MLKKSEALKQLLLFALPIMFGHVGLMLIGTGDMVIAGRYSRECLAAIGLSISIANPIMMLGLGLMFSISPLLAQKRGRGEDPADYFWTVITYALLVGVAASLLALISIEFVPLFGYSANITRLIQQYLLITAFSNLGICLFQSVKEVLQSQEKTFWANSVALGAAGVHVFFNYSFVFGAFGFPNLHEAGLAYATLLIRTLMALTLLLVAFGYWKKSRRFDRAFAFEMFKVGGPITISIFFEVMAFCSVTLFVGKFAEDQVAANNLALNVASLAFMIPMSMASAVAVKVGHAFGEKNLSNIRMFSRVCLFASVCFTLLMGATFYFFPGPILGLYTQDVSVLSWGKTLLFWVACFQVFDGAQVTLSGVLRGLSVTTPSSIAIFIGYWIVGIPLGYYLGFYAGLEAQGFWIGLALSLALVATMLGLILKRKLKALESEGL